MVLEFVYRKHRVKRSIKVPAISNKIADIPPDEYSWRKYGQKPIKGSPHPRYIYIYIYIFIFFLVSIYSFDSCAGDTTSAAV